MAASEGLIVHGDLSLVNEIICAGGEQAPAAFDECEAEGRG